MNIGLFSQLGLILVTVVIGFVYIKPTLEEISLIQDRIFEQVQAFEQVAELNRALGDLVNEANAISPSDNQALLTYMPDTLDEIAVVKDIETIVIASGLVPGDVKHSFADPEKKRNKDEKDTSIGYHTHTFRMGAVGTYGQLKELLSLIEQNDYPLFLKKGSVKTRQGTRSLLEIDLTFEGYSVLPGRVTEN